MCKANEGRIHMKKITALMLVTIMALSVVNTSFAVVKDSDIENIIKYVGMWYNHDNDNANEQSVIVIGKGLDSDNLNCTVHLISTDDHNNTLNNSYDITIDNKLDVLYCTNNEKLVAFTLKLEDDKLIRHSLYNDKELIYEKMGK